MKKASKGSKGKHIADMTFRELGNIVKKVIHKVAKTVSEATK